MENHETLKYLARRRVNNMNTKWKPGVARVTVHGIEHEQFFQGHGIAFTKFESTATGIGNSAFEAWEDAMYQIAFDGWDMEALEALLNEQGHIPRKTDDDPDLGEGCHWYVSVDVRSDSESDW